MTYHDTKEPAQVVRVAGADLWPAESTALN